MRKLIVIAAVSLTIFLAVLNERRGAVVSQGAVQPANTNLSVQTCNSGSSTGISCEVPKKVATTKTTPREDSKMRVPEFLPTEIQKDALQKSEELEREYVLRRETFMEKDLKVSPPDLKAMADLRERVIQVEKTLLNAPADSAERELSIRQELTENRLVYEQQIRQLIGRDKWEMFVSFYAEARRVQEPTRVSMHLPLK